MHVVLLGTGGSEGSLLPYYNDPKDELVRRYPFLRRKPTSVLVTDYETSILVDVGFDVVDYIPDVEPAAVFITHWHKDHTAGLFRLRWLGARIPLYAPRSAADRDIFYEPKGFDIQWLKHGDFTQVGPFSIRAVSLYHNTETLGYVIKHKDGTMVQILFDTKGLPPETETILSGTNPDLLLIDASFPPGFQDPWHNNVDEALAIAELIDPELVVLTHITRHNLPYPKLVEYVRKKAKNAVVALDGMVVPLSKELKEAPQIVANV